MKKLIALLLIASMIFSLVSCIEIEESEKDKESQEKKETKDPDDADKPEEFELIGTWKANITYGESIEASGNDIKDMGELASVFEKVMDETFMSIVLEFENNTEGHLAFDKEVTELFVAKLEDEFVEYCCSDEYFEVQFGVSREEFETMIEAEGMTMEDYTNEIETAAGSTFVADDMISTMGINTDGYDFTYTENKTEVILKNTKKDVIITIEDDGTLKMTNEEQGIDYVFHKTA